MKWILIIIKHRKLHNIHILTHFRLLEVLILQILCKGNCSWTADASNANFWFTCEEIGAVGTFISNIGATGPISCKNRTRFAPCTQYFVNWNVRSDIFIIETPGRRYFRNNQDEPDYCNGWECCTNMQLGKKMYKHLCRALLYYTGYLFTKLTTIDMR